LDRGADIATALIIDEAVEVVFSSEAGEEFALVLKDAAHQVARHARVERARIVGHDVNVVRLHSVPLAQFTIIACSF
jgi:hypothetical protein